LDGTGVETCAVAECFGTQAGPFIAFGNAESRAGPHFRLGSRAESDDWHRRGSRLNVAVQQLDRVFRPLASACRPLDILLPLAALGTLSTLQKRRNNSPFDSFARAKWWTAPRTKSALTKSALLMRGDREGEIRGPDYIAGVRSLSL
jgi:hypothetical protein